MILYTEEELIQFGQRLGELSFPNMVITLTGDLGAGKTTLTKGIGKGLDIKKIINSPTFTIVKTYDGRLPLYHFDAYRLEDSDTDLGFEEMLEDNGVSVIEWPMYMEDIIPEERLSISITINDDQSRSITINAIGNRYQEVLKELQDV